MVGFMVSRGVVPFAPFSDAGLDAAASDSRKNGIAKAY